MDYIQNYIKPKLKCKLHNLHFLQIIQIFTLFHNLNFCSIKFLETHIFFSPICWKNNNHWAVELVNLTFLYRNPSFWWRYPFWQKWNSGQSRAISDNLGQVALFFVSWIHPFPFFFCRCGRWRGFTTTGPWICWLRTWQKPAHVFCSLLFDARKALLKEAGSPCKRFCTHAVWQISCHVLLVFVSNDGSRCRF